MLKIIAGKRLRLQWACALLLACGCLWLPGAVAADTPVATIAAYSGDARLQRAGQPGTEQPVTGNPELFAGDMLITGRDGTISLLLADESIVRINRNTRLVLKAVGQSAGWLPASLQDLGRSLYELLEGELFFRNKNPETDLEIETPQVAIAVRGTEFVMRVIPGVATEVDMLEGRIEAYNAFGRIAAVSGEQVYAAQGKAPVKRVLLTPTNAVQWNFILPPVLPVPHTGGQPASASLAAAWADLEQNRFTEARDKFLQVTQDSPSDLSAWQGLALSLLASNDPDASMVAVNTAVELESGNPVSLLIRSYVQQALFDFDAALADAEQALAASPENVIVLIQVAQLHFGRGDIVTARNYSERALQLAGENAEVLSLAGFLALAQQDTLGAVDRFAQASLAAPGFAPPRLGLGLAYMRQGKREQALKAITEAVALEPARAIYVSYWGRILYELGRHERALQVLQRAAELDPRDPTPWYLMAVVSRDLNRFQDAIDFYNRAVALNSNRAIYRSQYLLDRDQALRNVDLSILFSKFGFYAWAERKAVDAVNQDFGNYSAHIMYAGALRGQDGREIAQGSEQLQAELLQPANINSFNNFNQYTSFLDSPNTQGSALYSAGSFDSRLGEFGIFGALPEQNLAYQLDVTDLSTSGWRGDNGEGFREFRVSVQWDATIRDGFLFRITDTNTHQQGYFLRRFEYDFDPEFDTSKAGSLSSFDLGYRRKINPNTDLLAFVSYVDFSISRDLYQWVDGSLPNFIASFEFTQEEHLDLDYWTGQLQLNARLGEHEIIAGTSHYLGDNDIRRTESLVRTVQLIGSDDIRVRTLFADAADTSNDRDFHSVYIQDSWDVADWLDLEAGLYYERLENSEPLSGQSWDQDELNPRAGAVVRASPKDTIRLAAFRYLAPFFGPQISPTEVAGVTIYRNVREGTLVTAAEMAYERSWGHGFFSLGGYWFDGNGEARQVADITESRDPDKYANPFVFEGDTTRWGTDLEYNQLLPGNLGLVARYLFADVEDEFRPEFDRKDHRLEALLRYIAPSGLTLSLTQGFRDYDYSNQPGGESMNYTDIGIEYLFPGRQVRLRFQANNIFDNNFNWVTDEFTLRGVIPRRNIFGTIQVNF
jgi:tetratricopeptide (TPR) repeat protein